MTARDHLRSILRVVEHHAMVYRRTWRGTVFSTFLNPILYLAALGAPLCVTIGLVAGEEAPAVS